MVPALRVALQITPGGGAALERGAPRPAVRALPGAIFSGNAVACRPQAGSERGIITTTGPLRLHTNGEELKTFATQVS